MLHLAPPSSSPHSFLPTIPSPLSPRSANIYGPRYYNNHMSTNNQKTLNDSATSNIAPAAFIFDAPAQSTSKPTPFSHRAIKKAPSPRQDELKDRRRNNFLNKVRDQRDERRYEARGEDMMRLDFMQRQRAYEMELALSAPDAPDTIIEDEEDEYELPSGSMPTWSQGSVMQMQMHMDGSSQLPSQQEEVVDFEREEEEEMKALMENMPTDDEEDAGSLWSDDVDYDALFEEVMRNEDGHGMGMEGVQKDAGEEMDMS